MDMEAIEVVPDLDVGRRTSTRSSAGTETGSVEEQGKVDKKRVLQTVSIVASASQLVGPPL